MLARLPLSPRKQLAVQLREGVGDVQLLSKQNGLSGVLRGRF
jgi:hypothetical protein